MRVVLIPASDRQVVDRGSIGKFQVGGVPIEEALPQLSFLQVLQDICNSNIIVINQELA